MKIVLVAPDNPGCIHDVSVLQKALGRVAAPQDSILVRLFPSDARLWDADRAAAVMEIDLDIDVVIFIEGVIEHPALMQARSRVLVPNPEWVDGSTLRLASEIGHVWHKSCFSRMQLAKTFERAEHHYIGFTSDDPQRRISDFSKFVHARGNTATHRNTSAIVRSWKDRDEWPELLILSYRTRGGAKFGNGEALENVVSISKWLDRESYLDLLGSHGVHLCTSEVEGFGHYINEARAMGALTVTTDAPPMNELVDEQSGVLVKSHTCEPFNLGTRYLVEPDEVAGAVERILGMTTETRYNLGENARKRYESESLAFRRRVCEAFTALRDR